MDGKGNRGAYAQVTAPLGDDPKVTVEQGGKSGMCSSCTRTRLGIAVFLAVAAIIIIIVIVVISKKDSKSDLVVQGTPTVAPNVTQAMGTSEHSNSSISMNDTIPSVPSQINMSMTTGTSMGNKPTTQPPPTTRMTFGPAVIGYFEGTFVMGETYGDFFDDVRAQMTIAFKRNFTEAMDEVYNVASATPYMYVGTEVNQLVENGTNVQVMFTVSLDAINRGGRDHLVTVLGSFPSNAMNTYPVLWADIKREIDPLENP